MSIHRAKIVIIGAGPAGLTAAIYAGRAGLSPIVAAGSIEGQLMPGGQLMITTEVENYPGFPNGIEGPELMDKFIEQAKRFGAQIIEEWATNFEFTQNGPHKLKIGNQRYETDAIIIATGASARWLNAPNEEKYRNHGISACATCDGPLSMFRNKDIYVVGGGDSACEEALYLTRFASSVTIIHRREQLRASKIMSARVLEHSKIQIMWNTEIIGYEGDACLQGIKVKNIMTGEIQTVVAAGLFMAIGHDPLTKEFINTGLELDFDGYIKTNNMVFTNINGVFTCGDVHDTIFRQAITASGFGCMAAIAAERWLNEKLI